MLQGLPEMMSEIFAITSTNCKWKAQCFFDTLEGINNHTKTVENNTNYLNELFAFKIELLTMENNIH